MKVVYNKATGAEVIAHEDPREPGRFALPAGSVDIEPPPFDIDTQTCSFDGTEWVVADIPIPEPEEPISAIEQLRMERDGLLFSSDWRMNEDYPYSDKEDWKVYRQELRELPSNSSPSLDENGILTNVTWPTAPGS